MQKLIIVPPIISNNSPTLSYAEKLTNNGQKRKIYCPHDPNKVFSLTTQHTYRFFQQPEIYHCECSDQCVERMLLEFRSQSIVIAGCQQTHDFAQQIINLVYGIKLPRMRLDSSQILIVRSDTDSYEITSPPIRLTSLLHDQGLVPR